MATETPPQGTPQYINQKSLVYTCPNLWRRQHCTRPEDDKCNAVWCPACVKIEQDNDQQAAASIQAIRHEAETQQLQHKAREKAALSTTKRGARRSLAVAPEKKTDGQSSTRAQTYDGKDVEKTESNCRGKGKHHIKHMEPNQNVTIYFSKPYRGKDGFPTICAICKAPIYAGKKEAWQTYFKKNNIDEYGNTLL